MFDINNISFDLNSGMHTCICPCDSPHDAEYMVAKYIGISRMFSISGQMYHRGSNAYIEAYLSNDVAKIASYINANYFMPPLDIYVFYGSSQKGLESRWCVGLDITNASQLIGLLNRQGPLINADNSPQSWFDKNGTSYSVVMLTGVLEQEQSEELEKRVKLCLSAIQNVTARKLTVHTIQ